MYAADELLTQAGVQVSVFEKLPTPYGLARAGVAPDHQATKRVTALFDKIAARRDFRFFLNVEVGSDLTHDELLEHHHAVLYAVGAPTDKRLDVEGMNLPGACTATEFVAWYNGHPDFADLSVDLSGERVVVVGNGNVALDVARILTADPDTLARTDIADHALAALRESNVSEVVIAARRGPAASAFTLPELIGLTARCEVVLDANDHQRVRDDLAAVTDDLTRRKLEILTKLGDSTAPITRPRIRFAYQLTPRRVLGAQRVTGMEFDVTGTDDVVTIEAGTVLTSIGYRGIPIQGLPFDEAAGVVLTTAAGFSTVTRRCTAATSPGGSSVVPPGSSARTSHVPRRPCAPWLPTTTRGVCLNRATGPQLWSASSVDDSPRSSTPPDGGRSTPPRWRVAKAPGRA